MPVAAGGQASCLNLPDLEFIGERARSNGYVSCEQSGPKVRELEICPLLRAARHHPLNLPPKPGLQLIYCVN